MMFGIIDRFEEDFAVVELESGEMKNINISKIPCKAKEGDVLQIGEIITIDKDKTEERKKKIQEFTKDMWK